MMSPEVLTAGLVDIKKFVEFFRTSPLPSDAEMAQVEHVLMKRALEFWHRAFILQQLPTVEEKRKPWMYQGWLLYQVQCSHQSGGLPGGDRWGYLAQVMTTGMLPEGFIPPVEFVTCAQTPALQMLEACRTWIMEKEGGNGLQPLMEWLAFGLGLQEKASSLPEVLQAKLYQGLEVQTLLQYPYDYWGHLLSESKGMGSRNNPTAFFPTPHAVCEAMVELLMSDRQEVAEKQGIDPRLLRVNDPCMGTGRMLLHASNRSLCLSGNDIDSIVLLGVAINGCLYAPWMVVNVQKFMRDLTTF
jgi:hypothetical protein